MSLNVQGTGLPSLCAPPQLSWGHSAAPQPPFKAGHKSHLLLEALANLLQAGRMPGEARTQSSFHSVGAPGLHATLPSAQREQIWDGSEETGQ